MRGGLCVILRGVAMLASALLVQNAFAGTFQVTPIRVNLTPAAQTAVLTVRNGGSEDSVIQVDVVAWSQEDGEDRYVPTPAMLATPPIFSLPAGGTQIVRVGLRQKLDAQTELAYRVFVQEVPKDAGPGGAVRVAVRFGIPIFVTPADMRPRKLLEWRAALTGSGDIRLSLANQGNQHVQVVTLALAKATGRAVLAKQDKMSYLLPGQWREWVLHPQQVLSPGEKLKVSARTDMGDIDAEVMLEQQ